MRLTTFFFFSFYFLVHLQSVGQELDFQVEHLLTSNTTPTYEEMIQFYEKYAHENERIALYNMGTTDAGLPLHLCVLNASKDSISTFQQAQNGTTIFINNGIHPGEPCGINASMQLVHEYAMTDESTQKSFPTIAIIPAYNVGGMLNRSSTSRANQNGPEEYGFRGNARNLDLNRDFIKMDSENMRSFARIFHSLDPDLFIDTHTSNGADYQYTMTYIAPIKERLPVSIRKLQYDNCIPYIEKNLPLKWGYDFFPYVALKEKTLDKGMYAFNATPRYSMGYAELFHSISFTTEAHMLKPFPDRARSTFAVLMEIIGWTMTNSEEIERARQQAKKQALGLKKLPIKYTLTDTAESIQFKGYEWSFETSDITEQKRLKYHSEKPFEREIPYYSDYATTDTITIPSYYIIKGSEKDLIERLTMNEVKFTRVKKDSTIQAEQCAIHAFESVDKPYEGRFLHFNTDAVWEEKELRVEPRDILIPVNQDKANFILYTIDPRQPDSYFNWNFFDSYVQQKEYFSPYVFEDIATELLKEDKELRQAFQEKLKNDRSFSESRWEQLYFIYQRSPYFEKAFYQLPIYRVK